MIHDEIFGFACDYICNVLVHPKGGFTTGHPADAGDTVDDGIVMSLTGLQFHEFRVFKSGRPVAHFVVIVHGNGVVGV